MSLATFAYKWIAGYPLTGDIAQAGIDACTLNNALNIAQLVVLVALLRWVRTERR